MLRSLSLACLLLTGMLVGCSTTGEHKNDSGYGDSQAKHSAVKPVKNARKQLQWAGTYQGILPCASCEGVSTMLVIKPDMTYSTRTRMLGVDKKDRTSQGTFQWLPDNSSIVLEGKEQRQVFRIYDGMIELRLPNGDAIPTQNPGLYQLMKTD